MPIYSCRSQFTLFLLIVFTVCLVSSSAQQVDIVTSSKAGDRFTRKPVRHFSTILPDAQGTVTVDDKTRYQRIDGFGASFLEAGLICINYLPPNRQEAVFRALFDRKTGAGFSAMKTVIASTDFMSAGPFYSYDDVPGDKDLKYFSIARDLQRNGLVTYIKRAQRYGKFALEAPMDYPPDWMLVNLETNQDVDPRYYDALSHYYLRYLIEYRKRGIVINYLSPFNEPGNYTKISYHEIGDLIDSHLGPLFEKTRIHTLLTPGEPPVRADAARDFPIVLSKKRSNRYIHLLPYHGYDFKDYDKIATLHNTYPELPLWMTEICYAAIANTPSANRLPRTDFEDGDFWGNTIFDDLEASASAWIYWNMVLDERGGPWLVSTIHADPEVNPQQPIVIVNRRSNTVTYTGLYYYLAHFSKYIRPGSQRIGTSVDGATGVRAMAFGTPKGGIIVELMNSTPRDRAINIAFHGKAARILLPAVSITTATWVTERKR